MTPAEMQAELEAMNAELNEVLQRYAPRFAGALTPIAVVIRTATGLGVFSKQSHEHLGKTFAELAVIYNDGHRPYAAVPPRNKSRG